MSLTTVNDVIKLFRALSSEEIERARELIPAVEASIKIEAQNVNCKLDELLKDDDYKTVFKSVVVDVVARTLMTSTNQEPMTQESQSALGYSWSGTYLVPGGGLFIKKTELARLGLRKQRYGVIDFYENKRDDGLFN